MKRVICLYRVSTKGQVDKDDIPMQRIECRKFIETQGWTLVGEYAEKGVSGFKVSAEKRDAIMSIRKEAERGAFDVLLVFMFDRLGRRDDETPFLVEWFISKGIEVWSTREGQQKMESRADKLINYIRYWQAGGESEKTSERVRTKHRQMVEAGLWRGGARPFGYKLIHTGRIGKKNRQLFDLAIDEKESGIIRDIFDGYIRRGMGMHRLANYLNSHYPSPDKIWAPQSIKTILTNPIYIGISRCGDVRSPVNEALRIVSDEDFQFARHVMDMRVTRKTQTRGDIDEDNLDEAKRTKTSIYGASLLSGLLYCAHCGHKLVGTYHTKQRANGAYYYRPVYRCYNGATKAKGCDGQRTYSAARIEKAVLEIVHQYFSHFGESMDAVWKEQQRLQIKQGSGARLKQAELSLSRLQAQHKKLREELVKVLMGESVFDEETIKSMLDEKQDAIEKAEAYLKEVRAFAEDTEQKLQQLIFQYRSIKNWSSVFDQANVDEKKMILARIIEKITVDKNYNISIYFFLTLEDFRKEMEDNAEKIEILEASQCI